MKLKFVLASAVLAMGAFAAAQAVGEDQHHDEHHAAPQQGGSHEHGGPPPAGPRGEHVHGPQGGTMNGPPHNTGNNMMMGGPHNSGNNTMMTGDHHDHRGQMNGGNRGAMMGHGPNRNFDRHAYQRNFTAPRRFHVGGYERPHGWYEHRWSYGEFLPALFWTQNYWLADYYDYGLADPPPGFVWVRYGNDALLIDQNTGEVLQVEYDVFY